MKKVLIIEDDQIVANIYRNKLATEGGFAVEVSLDGESGLNMIKTFQPDALVLDLIIPKISGVDVIKKIRATPELRNLPIIVFSNTYLTNTIQQAWKAGASKCLSKASCSPKHLVDVVRATLTAAPSSPAAATAGNAPANQPQTKPAAPAASAPAQQSPAELRKTLLHSFPATVSALRTQLQGVIKAANEVGRREQLEQLHRRVHLLSGNAAVAELQLLATMCDALEALVQELHDKPKNVNASTLRTLAGAIDCLGILGENGRSAAHHELPPVTILVVDDEPISRRAVVSALERAKLKSEAVDGPQAALAKLAAAKYDLIFLDIDMPGMSGHELCSKIRTMPNQQRTAVIFVTGLSGFDARANSMMSGGTDFIAKPFLSLELAVKALIYVVRCHLEKPSTRPLQPA